MPVRRPMRRAAPPWFGARDTPQFQKKPLQATPPRRAPDSRESRFPPAVDAKGSRRSKAGDHTRTSTDFPDLHSCLPANAEIGHVARIVGKNRNTTGCALLNRDRAGAPNAAAGSTELLWRREYTRSGPIGLGEISLRHWLRILPLIQIGLDPEEGALPSLGVGVRQERPRFAGSLKG